MKRPAPVTGRALVGGFISKLKATGAGHGVWAVRGRVFARVMVAARDTRLSGAEWSVLSTIALHLQHLGRSKGMMTLDSLADDCMVTQRTVRNALRTLKAAKFVNSTIRNDGRMTLTLDPRFGPKAPVAGDKSVDNSPRRSAARKKISKKSPPVGFSHSSVVEGLYSPPKRLNDSAPSAGAPGRESPGISRDGRTATAARSERPRRRPAPWFRSTRGGTGPPRPG